MSSVFFDSVCFTFLATEKRCEILLQFIAAIVDRIFPPIERYIMCVPVLRLHSCHIKEVLVTLSSICNNQH